MKKRCGILLKVSVVLIIIGIFLTSCGPIFTSKDASIDSELTSSEEIEQSPIGQAPDPSSLTGTLVVMTPIDPTLDNAYSDTVRQLFQLFTDKYPNVTLEARVVPSTELGSQFAITAEANDAPDVFFFSRPGLPGILKTEQVADLTAFVQRDIDISDFDPFLMDGVTFNDKIYAIPTSTDYNALFYRKDLFEEAGLQAPETWDDVIEAGKILTKDLDSDGTIDQWGLTVDGTSPSLAQNWAQFMIANGGSLSDGNGTATFTDAGSIEAVQWLSDMVNVEKIVSLDDMAGANATEILSSGKAAMAFGQMWYLLMFPPDIAANIAVAPLPKPENGTHVTFAGGWVLGMSTQIENPELGWAWIKTLSTPEAQLLWNKLLFNVPASLTARQDPFFSEGLMSEIIEINQGLGVEYPSDVDGEYWNVLNAAIQSVVAGQSSAEEALNNAAIEYNSK